MRKGLLMILVLSFLLLGSTSLLATSKEVPWDLRLNFFSPTSKNLTFKDFKGKVLLVNFFATYCPPCQVELYEFSNLYQELKSQGVEIISFMVDAGGERLLPHLIYSKKIKYYVAVADENVLSAFGWPDILPTTFLVDREGLIVRKFVGFIGSETLKDEIKKILVSR